MSTDSVNSKHVLYCDIKNCKRRWVSWEGETIVDTVKAATFAGWIVVLHGHHCPKHVDQRPE